MYQSGRAGDKAKKRKSPAKSGRVGITGIVYFVSSSVCLLLLIQYSIQLFHLHLNCI